MGTERVYFGGCYEFRRGRGFKQERMSKVVNKPVTYLGNIKAENKFVFSSREEQYTERIPSSREVMAIRESFCLNRF